MPRLVLIANPGTPRCEAFVRSARGCGIEPVVVPWAEVIPAGGDLDHLREFDQPAVVRLESPGKDAAVARLLLAAGDPHADWPAVPPLKGLFLRPGLQFQGFVGVLAGLRKSFDARTHLAPTACPLAVARMFDKNGTLTDLSAAGIPVPEFVSPEDPPADPDSLLAAVRDRGWPVAYLKLNTGAGGTGIVVCRFDGSAWAGNTTLLRRGNEFFNSRRLQPVSGAELRECVAFLLREGITVQRGIPHAQLDGQNADLRVVCVGGKPVATVFRLSPHPITNLHLGGRRGEWQRCRNAIPTRCWLDALDSASAAAGCFNSLMVGVDVVFEPGFRRHAVLELNAFGDFFPGWIDPTGRSLHQIELAAFRPLMNAR
jgi:glutathione synthase/RimK-type ligase-like ATP-grasp enzyme